MKRFITRFLTVSLAILFAVLATGCIPPTILSFNNNFAGGKDPSELTSGTKPYVETLIYDVEYVEKYDGISKSSTVSTPTPKYNGTFTSTFTDTVVKENIPNSDISSNADFSNGNIYYLKTELDLTVTADSIEKTYNDMIINEVYFYQSSLSYAPIWSKTTMKMTSFALSVEGLNPSQDIYQFETIYNTASYTMTKKIYQKDKDEDINLVDINEPNWTSEKLKEESSISPKTYEYTLKTLIDNNQLFFMLRNLNFMTQQASNDKIQQYAYLPTVSFAYGQEKTLHIVVENEETHNFQHDLTDGTKLDENEQSSMLVNKISFVLSANEYTGTKKYIKVQKQKTEQYDKALPVEYAEPLIDKTMTTYGALKYSLKQAIYN